MMTGNTQSPTAIAVGLSFIEQLHAIAAKACINPKVPYLSGHSPENEIALLTRASCKTWACDTCAARNAKRWIARIINGVNRLDGEWFMFTLTAHEKWRGHELSVKNIRQGWKKLYNRMIRKFKTSSYVKVWEMHNDGTFHLHGLIDTKIPKRWLKNNARQCGMGYQVEIHHVDNAGQVAGYISKYFLKSEGMLKDGWIWPKNLRRIEVSRNWPKLEKTTMENDFAWEIHQTREGQLERAKLYRIHGVKIIDMVNENNNDLAEGL